MTAKLRTVFRTCTLCEAQCGLQIELDGDQILSVRGDESDVFSQGYVCPKGTALGEIHHDPDRLQQPLIRNSKGEFEVTDWDTALQFAAEGLSKVRAEHGGDALAAYIGNPIIHNPGAMLLRQALLKALGTKNSFSAGSQDTSPRFATSYYLYGTSLTTPVPDIDRTDFFFCLGANPVVSNGSAMTAPGIKQRLKALQARDGKLVVIDPRRTETAEMADEHLFIKPGSDVFLLLGMIKVILQRRALEPEVLAKLEGWSELQPRLERLDLATAAERTSISEADITRLAEEFMNARSSSAYSRIGICNSQYGSLGTYATDLLNIVAGRLGEEGGYMFSTPAIDATRLLTMPGMDGHNRWQSRLRKLPETFGDLPSSVMAEEMETPGAGQIRGLLTFAGNPVSSVPNGPRLDQAISGLDFMVAVDLYVNETTRHANVILPPAWCLSEPYVDTFFGAMSVRNIGRSSPAVVSSPPDAKADWQILLGLIERLGGGPTGIKAADWALRVAQTCGYRWQPETMINFLLRTGRHGDKYLPWSSGLNLKKLEEFPHGLDLGPLEVGIKHRVTHSHQRVNIAPPAFVDALDSVLQEAAHNVADKNTGDLYLIGRRDIRSNNSWMHNAPTLVKGKPRCVLYVHPDDASQRQLSDGDSVRMESRVHKGPIEIHVTDSVAPGVVCMPHGWGHQALAEHQKVAAQQPGPSMNDWTDDERVEAVVGQSILNGVPVQIYAQEHV